MGSEKQTRVVPSCMGRPREGPKGPAVGQEGAGAKGGSEVGTTVPSTTRAQTHCTPMRRVV